VTAKCDLSNWTKLLFRAQHKAIGRESVGEATYVFVWLAREEEWEESASSFSDAVFVTAYGAYGVDARLLEMCNKPFANQAGNGLIFSPVCCGSN